MRKTVFSIFRRNGVEHLALAGNLVSNPKFWIILASDTVLLFAALYFSYYLRYEHILDLQGLFDPYFSIFSLILLIKLPVFYFFGLYRGVWRYTGTRDLINIGKAICFSFILVLTALLYINRFEGFSRSVFIMDAVFSFLFVSGHRLCIRYLYKGKNGAGKLLYLPKKTQKKRLLLIGAGDIAEKVLREITGNSDSGYEPVGLLDDDLGKIGRKIHGVPVLGTIINLEKHVSRTHAHEVLITIAATGTNEMKRFVDLCRITRLPFKIIPCFSEILDGNVSIRAIRNISYKDLLGREKVELEQDKIGEYISGATVLVTGAGGSIGSELCRQLVRFKPAKLILFDSSEENLHNIQMELIHEHKVDDVVPVLGQVQDVNLVRLVFSNHKPQVVFHGAAYKHVPLVERNPWEAVYNNIIGTRVLIEASILFQVARFVLISTDKAVRPTNVMGASKRCTELLLKAYDRMSWDGRFSNHWEGLCQSGVELSSSAGNLYELHKTRFMAVRFGNVIGSSGSVIPLFKRQIEKGGPVTVTHPSMTRYFMLVEEAAQLTLQAGAMSDGGEIFILKMGRPVNIGRMARDLIKLAGKEPDTEIDIKYTSLRDGEKLYEELITVGEGIVKTDHDKILVLKSDPAVACDSLNRHIDILEEQSKDCDGPAIKRTLKMMIPEYMPDMESRSIHETDPVGYSEEVAMKVIN
ncbi:polysaccharide biosynthesis protein [Desulfosediminicola flagellatus]|uniref:polysaccharide biosynthesis protein n=1 Tax=Desulfosediminicola flagellatus TaxID=2569541 RepID=UPI0010ABF9EC|nr:nucleoside-diphosphate sugar epimerase/dehydratase [Desulfosediminicola flagellatus]